ncbi:TAXI family TRAP transporter solute-binding subunit [Marinobacterium aestuariivivens]|uniref:TAXI family TRAP transporter solute-binding subunit n=1 Tax=Marinobacterium aestuariivivens TaxID=1698799 RepID=A0ABW2A2A3_9GAMM
MTWTSYDVGSAGYAEASAIADAFGKEYGTRVRIRPSGSPIGRLQSLLTGQTEYGFLATEAFFSSEGTYDFADRRWGPQNLRTLGGRPSTTGLVTAADANIRSIEDVRGKRVAYVVGNPSLNVKCDAVLAFGSLSREDVEIRMFPTYAAAMSSLSQNQADAACTTPTTSQLYELAESPRGIHWVDIPADDQEGWARVKQVAPFFKAYEETIGAGLSEEQPVNMLAWRYPVLVTLADRSAEEVYSFIKALDETYGLYNKATSAMSRWSLDGAGTPPIDVPFHEGAIRYLKEKGIWTEAHQAWNDARLARLEALRNAWSRALAEADGKSDEAFAAIWERYRAEAVASH